ncbi:MAG: hypothetical protein H0U70_13335 [Tatlockia sp.]|nr:hypothetical protein [Tatlockia sp.]
MSKVIIYLQSDVNEGTKIFISELNKYYPEYDLRYLDNNVAFKAPTDRPSYSHKPFHRVSSYYHYDNPPTNSHSEDFQKLELFAAQFKKDLENVLITSPRINEVINSNNTMKFGYDSSLSKGFFSENRSLSTRVKRELLSAAICTVIALPLVFFEPYSATMLFLCAAILIFAALRHNKQDKEMEALQFAH